MKVVLTTLNAKYIHSALALYYLKTYCQPLQTDIVIKEFSINNDLLEILSEIYREKPDIVGLACYIWNIDMILSLVNLLKKVMPKVTIVLGGPEVSYDPESIMRQNGAVDYLVQGEGEVTFFQLLACILRNEPVERIEGLGYRNGDKIIISGHPQIVKQLDEIPFPYSAEDLANFSDKIIYYESSRGCPYSCAYCLSSTTRGVRYLSLDRVYHDLQTILDFDVKQVKFVDRTFNACKKHYFPIIQFLALQNCRTNFHFEIAADILDDEILTFLQQAPPGRFQFEIGVQSTNELTLRTVNRCNNWAKIEKSVKTLRAYNNIHLHLDLIVGLPYEDYSRFGESFNAVYSLKPHMLQIGFLKLLKGSGIREAASDHAYVFTEHAPYEILANKYISYADIRFLKIIEKIFNQVYNSGKFQHTLAWLIHIHGNNAFYFFHDLAKFWEDANLHLTAHTNKNIYRYLIDFCVEYHSLQLEDLYEFVKFDILFSEKGILLQDILPWNNNTMWDEQKNNFWRNEEKVRKYLPDYRFTTWRDIKKYYHIEVFAFNVPAYCKMTEVVRQKTAVLFDYRHFSYQLLNPADFWLEG